MPFWKTDVSQTQVIGLNTGVSGGSSLARARQARLDDLMVPSDLNLHECIENLATNFGSHFGLLRYLQPRGSD